MTRGLDTNTLVRYVTSDDRTQALAVRELIADAERTGERLHICTVVLCELVWVLSGAAYGFDRGALSSLLAQMLQAPVFEFQARDRVRRALASFAAGGAEFADYLIREENRAAGCDETVTFDRRLRASPGFTLLGS